MENLRAIVKEVMKDCPAHDLEHVERVYNIALQLSSDESVDLEVVKAAALLHDIAGAQEIKNTRVDHSVEGAKMAEPILKQIGFPKEKISHVQACISTHRYKSGHEPKTREAEIVYDADKIDTIGAMGVARSYVWIGRNNARMFNKEDVKSYARENLGANGRILDHTKHSPQIEWETKYKHIPERMHSPQARQMAEERLQYMRSFFERLEKERKGER